MRRLSPTLIALPMALALSLSLSACDKAKDSGKSSSKTTTTAPTAPGASRPATPPDTSQQVRPPKAEDLAEYVKDLPGSGKLMAKIVTNKGEFNCELYEKQAPMTVANFVGLGRGLKPWRDPKSGKVMTTPFFNGVIFHRVIPDFMIQGGDPLGKGIGGPGYKFADEFHPDLRHATGGMLSMANSGPGTNGSQFFITEGPTPHLDNRHTVFGKCAEIDLVKQIARVPAGAGNRPLEEVRIERIDFSRSE